MLWPLGDHACMHCEYVMRLPVICTEVFIAVNDFNADFISEMFSVSKNYYEIRDTCYLDLTGSVHPQG